MLDLATLARPESPTEAVRLFHELPGAGLYVAGGTIVVRAGSPNLDYLVDLSRAGLGYFRPIDGGRGGLAVGAGVTLADLRRSAEVTEFAGGMLVRAAGCAATNTIRNRATVGGNIAAWAFPTDLPPVLLVLGSTVALLGPDGEREVSFDDLCANRRGTFRKGDLITEVRIPAAARGLSGAFDKIGRKRVDVALVGCAAALDIDGGVIRTGRIALNGVAGSPVRVTSAESALAGSRPTEEAFREAARLASESVSPRTDHRASGEYRRKLVAVLVRRALARAAGMLEE